jgi:hypothetical protein
VRQLRIDFLGDDAVAVDQVIGLIKVKARIVA